MKLKNENNQIIDTLYNDYEKVRLDLNINKVDSESAQEWLNDAKEEFSAFECLKNNNLQSKSINHLVLCVEKIVKSYGILNGFITNKTAKSQIGHISPRVFLKILGNKKFQLFLNTYMPHYNNKGINKKIETLENMTSKKGINNKNIEQFANISKGEIIEIWNKFDEIKNKISKLLANLTIEEAFNKREEGYKLKNSIKKYLIHHKVWNKIKKLKLEDFYNGYILNMQLFLLAIITFPHYTSSNFPINAFNNKVDYNQSLGIVASLDLIEKKVKETINLLEENIEKIK